MARRPGDREPRLSPGARRIAGWVAAIALVGGIALGVRLVGGTGDGSPAAGSSPASAADPRPITFGTGLDPATGLVAIATRTTDFQDDEAFVYSVADVSPPPTVFVEVERVGGGPAAIVQEPSMQTLAPEAVAIAFSVPAAVLLEAFGPGEYRMRIYRAGETVPIAEGTFVLVASVVTSPAPTS